MVSAQTQTLSYAERAKKGSSSSVSVGRAVPSLSASTSSSASNVLLPAGGANNIPLNSSARASGPATSPHAATVAVASGSVSSDPHPPTTNGINGTSANPVLSPPAGAGQAPTLLSPSASSLPSLPSLPTPTNTSKPSTPPALASSGVGKTNVWAVRRELRERGVSVPAVGAAPGAANPPAANHTPPAGAAEPAERGTPPLSSPTTTSPPSNVSLPPSLALSTSTKPSSSRSSQPGSRVSPAAAVALLHPIGVLPNAASGPGAGNGSGSGASEAVAAAVLKPRPAGEVGSASTSVSGSVVGVSTSIPSAAPPPAAVLSTAPSATGAVEGVLGDTAAWPEPSVSLREVERERERREVRGSPGERGEELAASVSGGRKPGKKTEWVHIPATELLAAVDAVTPHHPHHAHSHGHPSRASSSRGASVAPSADRSPHHTNARHRLPPRPQVNPVVNNMMNPTYLPPGSASSGPMEEYGNGGQQRRSGRPTPTGSAQRSRRPSSSGVRTRPTSIAPSPAHRNVYLEQQYPAPTGMGGHGLAYARPPGSMPIIGAGVGGPVVGVGLSGDDMLVPPAHMVPAPPPVRKRRKASRPGKRAVGVRMPRLVDGEERPAEAGGGGLVFGSAEGNGEEQEELLRGGERANEEDVELVKQRGRFGIGVELPPQHPPPPYQQQGQPQPIESGGMTYPPVPGGGSGYVSPSYASSRPESALRMAPGGSMLGLGMPGPNGMLGGGGAFNGFAPPGQQGGMLQFGAPGPDLTGVTSPEVRGALGLGDMDLPPPPAGMGPGGPGGMGMNGPGPGPHGRRRSSGAGPGYDREPPTAPRAQRFGDDRGYGPPNGRGRGGRGMGGRGQYGPRGGFRGGPGGFRNNGGPAGYGAPLPPPPGAYGMPPYDPADPESYLHGPPGPPGPPPHMQGMDLPPMPGYPMGPPPGAPWMLPPPGYGMPPGMAPGFVPPYAQYPPAPGMPPPQNGMPYPPMPGAAPIPTPVTLLSFPLDPLRYYLLGQVEYYFSLHNLVNDVFLRNQMDNEGWVDIGIVASFNRMRTLTNEYALVREVMELSSLVEVRGDRVRLSNGHWQQFVMHRTPRQPGLPGAPNPGMMPGMGRGMGMNGELDSVTTATNTAPGSEIASASAMTTPSVPEEEGELKESEATP